MRRLIFMRSTVGTRRSSRSRRSDCWADGFLHGHGPWSSNGQKPIGRNCGRIGICVAVERARRASIRWSNVEMELHRIESIEACEGFALRLTYDDGCVVRADFSKLIRQGGVFAPLGQESFFRRVKVRNDGREVAWPGSIDFCADALRKKGKIEKAGRRRSIRSRSVVQRQRQS